MRRIRAQIIKLEERIRPRLEERERKPIGITLGIDPKHFLQEFNIAARIGQQTKLPGVPIRWLRLSDEERLETIISACYRNEHSKLSRVQSDAFLEMLHLIGQLQDGKLKSEMKRPDIENGKWFIVADFVRDDKAYVYSTNDKSLILHWAYELVRKAMPLDQRIIACLEASQGCTLTYRSFHDDYVFIQNKGRDYPRPYDTDVLENSFELTRLNIVQHPQVNHSYK